MVIMPPLKVMVSKKNKSEEERIKCRKTNNKDDAGNEKKKSKLPKIKWKGVVRQTYKKRHR